MAVPPNSTNPWDVARRAFALHPRTVDDVARQTGLDRGFVLDSIVKSLERCESRESDQIVRCSKAGARVYDVDAVFVMREWLPWEAARLAFPGATVFFSVVEPDEATVPLLDLGTTIRLYRVDADGGNEWWVEIVFCGARVYRGDSKDIRVALVGARSYLTAFAEKINEITRGSTWPG